MADDAQMIRSIHWREVFPFTHLFRAFRIAVHPSKLFLALAALLAIYFGGRLLDVAWVDRHKPAGVHEIQAYGESYRPPAGAYPEGIIPLELQDEMRRALLDRGPDEIVVNDSQRPGIFMTFFEYELAQVDLIVTSVLRLQGAAMFEGVWRFIAVGPMWLFALHPLFGMIFIAWFLLIWSIFGGAISRIAAVHVARDEKISVRQAMRFSVSKVLSFLFAPLIPLLIVMVIGVIVAAVGWVLFSIPVAGPIVASLVFFLALLAGFIMTLVTLGTIGGFNLMYPTVAVEGSDSFDAISRSFSYVFARPWRMLFYTVIAIAYGALTYLFVRLFVYLTLGLTHFFVGWWLGGKREANYELIWPTPSWDSLPYTPGYNQLNHGGDFAAGMTSLWVYLVIGLLGAYAISFYFSVNSIIYYLMRREVDATELDDVYLEESEDDFGDAPAAPLATGSSSPATVGGEGAAAVSRPADVPEGGAARAYDSTANAPSGSTPSDSGGTPPPSNA